MNSGSVKKSVTIDADLEKVWTKIYFSYIAISGLPLNAYHATISVQKSNKNTKVTWESYFASDNTKKEFDEFIEFLSNFYAQSLKNLKSELS